MNRFSWLVVFVFMTSITLFAQEKYVRHTVSATETINDIAKMYHVSVESIYEVNPDAIKGIKKDAVLLIPSAVKKTVASTQSESKNTSVNTHEVLPKETIYGITKQFKVSVQELYDSNPNLESEGLKIGQTIIIPNKASAPAKKAKSQTAVSEKNNTVKQESFVREVLPKESYYSIARQYNISVSELKNANPTLDGESLKIGDKISIPAAATPNSGEPESVTAVTEIKSSAERKQTEQTKQIAVVAKAKVETKEIQKGVAYEVWPEETYSSIADRYNISVAELQKANPALENKPLKAGDTITIPVKESNVSLGDSVPIVAKVEKNQAFEKKQETQVKQIAVVAQAAIKPEETQIGVDYEVWPGETYSSIADKNNITVAELQNANPDSENKPLEPGQIIIIPVKIGAKPSSDLEIKSVATDKKNAINETPPKTVSNVQAEGVKTVQQGITYQVLPKETYYSIAKKYNITVAELQKANPEFKNQALKSGQKITIPVKTAPASPSVLETPKKLDEYDSGANDLQMQDGMVLVQKDIKYQVLSKETYYSIAKKNKITVAELQKANPTLGNTPLKAGQKIMIPSIAVAGITLVNKEAKDSATVGKDTGANQSLETVYTHKVLPKETKYGIAKEYGITVAELEKQNPSTLKSFAIGTKLNIRSSKPMQSEAVNEVVVKEEVKIETDIASDSVELADKLVVTASDNIGTRYRSGGVTKDGFDCSGLIYATFGMYDISLPRTSIEMSNYGTVVSTNEAQKGDLIFFKTSRRQQINHVGMVVEVLDGEIKFIHSATHGGVMISSTKESYYEKNFAQINRVLNKK